VTSKPAPKCPRCGMWLESGALVRATRFWEKAIGADFVPFAVSGTISFLAIVSLPLVLLFNLFSDRDKTFWCWRCRQSYTREELQSSAP
jgi:hypothetical protein